MRTLWVAEVSGGPFKFTATQPGKTALGLEEAHRDLKISPAEFDEVAAELGRTLDFAKVPKREKAEVLAAFAAEAFVVSSSAHLLPREPAGNLEAEMKSVDRDGDRLRVHLFHERG
jgi:hypothetical protein